MKLLSAIALGLQVVAAKVSYDGYKVYHIDADDYEAATSAIKGLDYVSLSCESNHKALEIAVAPGSQAKFEKLDLDAKVTIEDLGANIAKEGELKPYKAKSKRSSSCKGLPDISYFDSYHVFEEHLDFLDDLHAAFVDNSEVFIAGDSLEGRPISGIHLWGSDGPGKPAIIWHGTVHAREWIVAPTVEYMAYQLIAGYRKKDELLTKVMDQYDFYIMPVVNPDGYVYTTDEDRLWRKNRQVREDIECVGTDVNRNWPYQWDVSGGSEIDPCDEAYRGEAPGDTPEMAVLTNHTLSIANEAGIKFYVDWHAYSQLLLLPYGYTCNSTIKEIDAQMELAGGVVEAIKSVNGLEFIYGPTCQTIYQVSGGSIDFVYDLAGAELAWAFELRPDSPDKGGFALPPEEIIESAEENWEGMKYLFQNF